MFGQYDGFVIVDLPDSRAAAATSLAVSSTGSFEHLETHELIEAEDLNPILEQAKGITSQLPVPSPSRFHTDPIPERPEPRSRSPGPGGKGRSSVRVGAAGSNSNQPTRRCAGRAGWRWLLGLQQPHVGGLGALGPRRHVELDGLPLIK